jgi:hypothetical protein
MCLHTRPILLLCIFLSGHDQPWWLFYVAYFDKSCVQQEENYFRQQIALKFKKETSKVLHFEHSIVWC